MNLSCAEVMCFFSDCGRFLVLDDMRLIMSISSYTFKKARESLKNCSLHSSRIVVNKATPSESSHASGRLFKMLRSSEQEKVYCEQS